MARKSESRNMLDRNIVLWYFVTIIDPNIVDIITRSKTYAKHTDYNVYVYLAWTRNYRSRGTWSFVMKLLLKNSFAKKSQITQTGMERQERRK